MIHLVKSFEKLKKKKKFLDFLMKLCKIQTYSHPQDKLSKLQPSEKPQLYIGGIFPITGTKYKAPELAAGIFS